MQRNGSNFSYQITRDGRLGTRLTGGRSTADPPAARRRHSRLRMGADGHPNQGRNRDLAVAWPTPRHTAPRTYPPVLRLTPVRARIGTCCSPLSASREASGSPRSRRARVFYETLEQVAAEHAESAARQGTAGPAPGRRAFRRALSASWEAAPCPAGGVVQTADAGVFRRAGAGRSTGRGPPADPARPHRPSPAPRYSLRGRPSGYAAGSSCPMNGEEVVPRSGGAGAWRGAGGGSVLIRRGCCPPAATGSRASSGPGPVQVDHARQLGEERCSRTRNGPGTPSVWCCGPRWSA